MKEEKGFLLNFIYRVHAIEKYLKERNITQVDFEIS